MDEKKKEYIKPVIEKHKAIAVISGSGTDCNYYSSRTSNGKYYF